MQCWRMSLFKAREWWSTIVGSDEEFDSGCLCVANIDNQANDGGKKYYCACVSLVKRCLFTMFVGTVSCNPVN